MYHENPGLVHDTDDFVLLLDWTEAFTLNSQLTKYELYIRDVTLDTPTAEKKYTGFETRYTLSVFSAG